MSVIVFSVVYVCICIIGLLPVRTQGLIGFSFHEVIGLLAGDEAHNFMLHVLIRNTATCIICAFCPLGYGLGMLAFTPELTFTQLQLLRYWLAASFTVFVGVCTLTFYWRTSHWINHPFIRKLRKFETPRNGIDNIVFQINCEFRRTPNFYVSHSRTTELIVTHSWIIKVTPFTINYAQQANTVLTVTKSDGRPHPYNNSNSVQFLTIEVQSPIADQFSLRVSNVDFEQLKSKVSCPMRIGENVKVYSSPLDWFLEDFLEIVQRNEPYECNEVAEMCAGCLDKPADVKLTKLCEDTPNGGGGGGCQSCACIPQWCIMCMGKWFAATQDQEQPQLWVYSRSRCPLCRQVFCLKDVRKVVKLGFD